MPAWKRCLDLACLGIAAPLLGPLLLGLAALIKIVSPGPVLFRQERIGYLGRPFRCLKFRTMVVDADTGPHQGHLGRLIESNAPMEKLDAEGDPRLIAGARVLRVLGLDELPQLHNVLRGEMSLVGPRPCLPYEYARYLPRHRRRCETLPGLTGLWQVRGKNRTTFEEMIALDLEYVRNRSLWLDVKIMAGTVRVLLVQLLDLRKRPAAARLGAGPSRDGPEIGPSKPGDNRRTDTDRLHSQEQEAR